MSWPSKPGSLSLIGSILTTRWRLRTQQSDESLSSGIADAGLSTFLSSTSYTRPVDFKKLCFIYSAIEEHTAIHDIMFEDLRVLEVGCGMGGIAIPLASEIG
jgi:2-polyprenyl-3-methyl-5-hydroxy-6-metoxy-1,4-benzoquinol methylase